MALKSLIGMMQPAIEEELIHFYKMPLLQKYPGMLEMLRYHMGWEGEGSGPDAQGKRIRPLILLLSASAVGGEWRKALPAAISVEILHNFSLIHDDIEDRSLLRRGRPTVYAKWGDALAINAGDAMFTTAYMALLGLERTASGEIALEATKVLYDTCLALTGGQHLDISYEKERSLSLSDYWPMVGGKTAALLAGSVEIGAIVGGASPDQRSCLQDFGYKLGLAFQVLDDYLGIWGDAEQIGKSNESDLVTGKKTLPVLFGLGQKGKFAERWMIGPLTVEEIPQISQLLIEEGAQKYTLEMADRLTNEALKSLEAAQCANEAGLALRELADLLLQRNK